jgi:hypothetical protein
MYPLTYEADYAEERNRVRVGFRLFLAIPWLVVSYVYLIGWSVVVFLAWFAVVFTARYPQSFYGFNTGFLRFYARYNGWLNLQTDEYPPFGFDPEPQYPLRLHVAPPQERYSRLRAFFRPIHAIPVLFVLYFVGGVMRFAAILDWFVIVFTGRQPAALHNILSFGNAYETRAMGYLSLMTETYPPISNQEVAPTIKPVDSPA